MLVEQLFLEEERERELEEMYSNTTNARGDRDELRVLPSGEEVPQAESTEVTKSTTETLMAGERIMEALELSEADRTALRAFQEEVRRMPNEEMAKRVPAPSRNAVFSMYDNCSAEEYVLKVVRAIPPAQLQDALLVLPFGNVVQLIEHIDVWAHKESPVTCSREAGIVHLLTLPHCIDNRDGSLRSRPACSSSSFERITRKSSQLVRFGRRWLRSRVTCETRSRSRRCGRLACGLMFRGLTGSALAEHAWVQPRRSQVPPASARVEQGRRVLREGCPWYGRDRRRRHGRREGRTSHD